MDSPPHSPASSELTRLLQIEGPRINLELIYGTAQGCECPQQGSGYLVAGASRRIVIGVGRSRKRLEVLSELLQVSLDVIA